MVMEYSTQHSPLGKDSTYSTKYDPGLLFPIPRAPKWQELGLDAQSLPYQGVDIWNGYELSWLEPSGKPTAAVAEFRIPADSPCLIESKSFKLYLNSLNQSRFDSWEAVREVLVRDLSCAAGKAVKVKLIPVDFTLEQPLASAPGHCIDSLEVTIDHYDSPNSDLLAVENVPGKAILSSHLLRSNCPVTGQPDWGTLIVEYEAPKRLMPESLLSYIVSFRRHADFHEQCVERIFLDLMTLLQPSKLTVCARYLRRGGLDINPWRSLQAGSPENLRLVRQ